jgi:hypothetical protein
MNIYRVAPSKHICFCNRCIPILVTSATVLKQYFINFKLHLKQLNLFVMMVYSYDFTKLSFKMAYIIQKNKKENILNQQEICLVGNVDDVNNLRSRYRCMNIRRRFSKKTFFISRRTPGARRWILLLKVERRYILTSAKI